MPTGGNTNAPKINPTIAAYSPFLLPPYVLTKYLLAIKSEIIKITVKTIIIKRKTTGECILLIKKAYRIKPNQRAITEGINGKSKPIKLSANNIMTINQSNVSIYDHLFPIFD